MSVDHNVYHKVLLGSKLPLLPVVGYGHKPNGWCFFFQVKYILCFQGRMTIPNVRSGWTLAQLGIQKKSSIELCQQPPRGLGPAAPPAAPAGGSSPYPVGENPVSKILPEQKSSKELMILKTILICSGFFETKKHPKPRLVDTNLLDHSEVDAASRDQSGARREATRGLDWTQVVRAKESKVVDTNTWATFWSDFQLASMEDGVSYKAWGNVSGAGSHYHRPSQKKEDY